MIVRRTPWSSREEWTPTIRLYQFTHFTPYSSRVPVRVNVSPCQLTVDHATWEYSYRDTPIIAGILRLTAAGLLLNCATAFKCAKTDTKRPVHAPASGYYS